MDLTERLNRLTQMSKDFDNSDEAIELLKRLGVMRPTDIRQLKEDIEIQREQFRRELIKLGEDANRS